MIIIIIKNLFFKFFKKSDIKKIIEKYISNSIVQPRSIIGFSLKSTDTKSNVLNIS